MGGRGIADTMPLENRAQIHWSKRQVVNASPVLRHSGHRRGGTDEGSPAYCATDAFTGPSTLISCASITVVPIWVATEMR